MRGWCIACTKYTTYTVLTSASEQAPSVDWSIWSARPELMYSSTTGHLKTSIPSRLSRNCVIRAWMWVSWMVRTSSAEWQRFQSSPHTTVSDKSLQVCFCKRSNWCFQKHISTKMGRMSTLTQCQKSNFCTKIEFWSNVANNLILNFCAKIQ